MIHHRPTAPRSPKKYIQIDGRQIAYIDQGEGFPVLLGHCYLWDGEMWRPQIDALSRHFRVLAPDLWGHGESDGLPATCESLDDLAALHAKFLDALNIEKCHAVGISIGGMWAARLAIEHPEKVERMVLMGTDLGAEDAMMRTRYFHILDRIADAGGFETAVIDTIMAMVFHSNGRTIPRYRQAYRQSLMQQSTIVLRDSLVPLGKMIFSRPDILHLAETLSADRTLVLSGEHDVPRPPAESRLMAERIGCRYVLVPDAAHIMNLEKPEFVNGILSTWLLGHAQQDQATGADRRHKNT